jgi:hypothetical protein
VTATIERVAPPPAADPGPPVRRTRVPQARLVLWLVAAVSLVLWLVGQASIPSAALSQFGLLMTASPLFTAGIVLAAVGFLAAVRYGRSADAGLLLLVFTAELRLPTATSTSVPLYSWTYKHLGVVDYIRETGGLAHGVDVYQGWPGLFAVTAWFSELTGLAPITIAHWFTPVFHLALVGLVFVLARVWGQPARTALVASFVVEALNWVGQDYYSPQATAIVLAAGFLICLGRCDGRTDGPGAPLLPVALVLFGALVVTHQLTPYWLIVACLLLTVTRRLRPRWLVVVMIAMAALVLAFNYDTAGQFSLLSLNPLQNAESNVPTVGVLGQRVTSLMVRALSVTLWVAAALAMLLGRRRREPVLAAGLLVLGSFLLLGGQGYGGEAIFRVFLYSLFGCALLVAPPLDRLLRARWPWAALGSIGVVLCVLVSAQGFYGSWFANRVSAGQVSAAEELLDSVPYPSYITETAPVWPERPTARYVRFSESTIDPDQGWDYPMIYEAKLTGVDFASQAAYDKLIETVEQRTAPTYLIITRQMAVYDWYFGILPLQSLTNLADRMLADPRWSVYARSSEYVIFKTTPEQIRER